MVPMSYGRRKSAGAAWRSSRSPRAASGCSDEPWDGPGNAKLANQTGNVFRRPEAAGESVMTSFVAVVGPKTVFPGARPMRFEELGDGAAKTILFVQVPDADIPWMEPRDPR